MAEIDQGALAYTLKRIKASLNKRYEKDAELYISYQDTLGIKQHLFEHEYEALTNMIDAGVVSKGVVAKVIAKNLWLIDNASKEETQKIEVLLRPCSREILLQIKESVDNSSAEMLPEIKVIIRKLFFKHADPHVCEDYLTSSGTKDNDLLKTCFQRVALSYEDEDDFEQLDGFFEMHPGLENEPEILSKVYKNLEGDAKNAFEEFVSSQVDDLSEMPRKPYRSVYCRFPGAIENLIELLDDSQTSYRSRGKQQANICRMIKQYIKIRATEDDISTIVDLIGDCYKEASDELKGCICKEIFIEASYKEEIRELMYKSLAKKLGTLPKELTAGASGIGSTMNSAADLYDFIISNPYSGVRWCGWAINNTIYKIKPKKQMDVLIDFLKQYVSQSSTLHIPDIFEYYVEHLRDGESQNFLKLISFFADVEKGKYGNAEKAKKDRTYAAQLQQELDNIREVEDAVINAAVNHHLRTGGTQGDWYKFLYDYRRNICKELFAD